MPVQEPSSPTSAFNRNSVISTPSSTTYFGTPTLSSVDERGVPLTTPPQPAHNIQADWSYRNHDARSSRAPVSTPPRAQPPPGASSLQMGYTQDEGRMSVSVDFGTTFSGVSYGSSRIDRGVVQQILQWPGTSETFRKIPTCLAYDSSSSLLAWGLEAKYVGRMPGTYRCEWCVTSAFNWAIIPKSHDNLPIGSSYFLNPTCYVIRRQWTHACRRYQ